MKEDNAWKTFEKTGKISDYINYKNTTNNEDYTLGISPIYEANQVLREIDDDKNKGASN